MQERFDTTNLTKNSEHGSHLIEGARPIIACLISPEDFGELLVPMYRDFNVRNPLKTIHNVDWNMDKATLDKQGFLNEGSFTYVISTIDNFNKFSESFLRCTGLVVAGTEKRTGKRISFLTHQDPNHVLTDLKDKFTADLETRLYEMRKRCVEGTIDAVIVGGRYIVDAGDDAGANVTEDYPASLELLEKEVKKVLGFEPTVINGPKNIRRLPKKEGALTDKTEHAVDNVYYDTEQNRLYLVRPKILNVGNFTSSDFDKHKDGLK
jgi:hypothetical protein